MMSDPVLVKGTSCCPRYTLPIGTNLSSASQLSLRLAIAHCTYEPNLVIERTEASHAGIPSAWETVCPQRAEHTPRFHAGTGHQGSTTSRVGGMQRLGAASVSYRPRLPEPRSTLSAFGRHVLYLAWHGQRCSPQRRPVVLACGICPAAGVLHSCSGRLPRRHGRTEEADCDGYGPTSDSVCHRG
jgi:hypothetical protein